MNENEVLIKLRNLCNKKGISLYQLANYSDVPMSTITSLFRHNSYPSIPTLTKLCNALNISLSDFFTSNVNLTELSEKDLHYLDKIHSLNLMQERYLSSYLDGLAGNNNLSN